MITQGVKAQNLERGDKVMLVFNDKGYRNWITDVVKTDSHILIKVMRNGEEHRHWFNFDEVVGKVIG